MAKAAKPATWAIRPGDCVPLLRQQGKGSVNLVFADPPFNIGREKYDNYDDKRPRDEYLKWSAEWIKGIHHVLHQHGSFWLAIGDGLVSELDVQAKEQGFHKRGHVIWLYTFGVNCARNFTRAHTHLLYYTKSKTRYVFNENDPELRVPSARQLVYNDKRAHPNGRLPDDVWVLRPQELANAFNGHSDAWLQSRICGTFKERIKGSDNQMPLPIMERIIRATSNPGDLVLDPFGGTFTTGEAAIRLGRSFLGFEISKAFCERGTKRLTGCSTLPVAKKAAKKATK